MLLFTESNHNQTTNLVPYVLSVATGGCRLLASVFVRMAAAHFALVTALVTCGAVGAYDHSAGWPAPVRLRVEGLEQRPQQPVVLSETLPRFSFSHGCQGAPRGLA